MQIRNNHRWLVLLLTFVVGMSPLVLNADAHQSYIDETEHHSYSEYSHESDNNQKDHSPSADIDIYHCCHCHGGTVVSVVPENASLVQVNDPSLQNTFLQDSLAPGVNTEPFRPPISS